MRVCVSCVVAVAFTFVSRLVNEERFRDVLVYVSRSITSDTWGAGRASISFCVLLVVSYIFSCDACFALALTLSSPPLFRSMLFFGAAHGK